MSATLAIVSEPEMQTLESAIDNSARFLSIVPVEFGSRITDGLDTNENQSYTYDGLGQMITSNGSWGAGTYEYDSLGNLHEKVEGSRTVDLTYDSNNRLTQSVDTGATGTRAVGYDGRGNITSLGTLAMTYDLSDQPTVVTGTASGVGTANGNYEYDGNLKRVKATVNGREIYNIYDASGTLIYVRKTAGGGQSEQEFDFVQAAGQTVLNVEYGVRVPFRRSASSDRTLL